MAIFVVKENWGNPGQPQKPQEKKDLEVFQIHHEPPRFELAGRRTNINGREWGVKVLVEEHVAIHLIRFRMFNRQEDHDAFLAQAPAMSEGQSDNFELLIDDEAIVRKWMKEIKRRRKVFGIEC